MLLLKIRFVVVSMAVASFLSLSLHGEEIEGFGTFERNSNADAVTLGLPQINGETMLLQPSFAGRNVPLSMLLTPSVSAFHATAIDISNGFQAEFDVIYSSSDIRPEPIDFIIHGDPRGASALFEFDLASDITPELRLRFDPDTATGSGTPSALGIQTTGSLLHRNYAFPNALDGLDNGGSTTHVEVSYDGSTGMLTSTLTGQLGVNVYTVPTLLSPIQENAYFGFAAFTIERLSGGNASGSVANFSLSTMPEVILGDVNLDGIVNFDDIPPFIAILQDGTFLAQADCNEDGIVDFADIPSFIAILQAG